VVLCVVCLMMLSNSGNGKLKGRLLKVNSQQYEKFRGFTYYVYSTLIAGCWLEVSSRKVLLLVTSAQVFFCFPVYISEC